MRRLTLAALLLSACASAGSGPTPLEAVAASRGGGSWVELQNEHFTLDTDLSPLHARKVLRQLEQLRTALLTAVWGKVKLEGDHTDVVVLESHGELAEFADENVAGYMFHGARPLLVGYGSDLGSQTIFAHELTHALSRRLLQRQPLWFSEGLAQFLQTLHLRDDGVAEIGDADLNLVTELNRRGRLPAARVLAFTGRDLAGMESAEVGGFYRTSWLLVHYLFNNRGQDFRRYQVALARGQDPGLAWSQIFGDLAPDKLDHELTVYLSYGRFSVLQIPVPQVSELDAALKPLDDAAVRSVRARLYLTALSTRTQAQRLAQAQAELAPAVQAAPGDPRVLEVEESWSKRPALLASARAAVQKHPDDPRAWRVLAWALGAQDATEAEKAERLQVMAKAVALEPSDVETLNAWAWQLDQSNHPDQAVPLARKAASIDPEPMVLDTLAVGLAELGQCGQALPVEQRALDLVPPEVKGAREDLRQHLAQMQQQCAGKP